MKIRTVLVELLQTDRHDEVNIGTSKCCERAYKRFLNKYITNSTICMSVFTRLGQWNMCCWSIGNFVELRGL